MKDKESHIIKKGTYTYNYKDPDKFKADLRYKTGDDGKTPEEISKEIADNNVKSNQDNVDKIINNMKKGEDRED